ARSLSSAFPSVGIAHRGAAGRARGGASPASLAQPTRRPRATARSRLTSACAAGVGRARRRSSGTGRARRGTCCRTCTRTSRSTPRPTSAGARPRTARIFRAFRASVGKVVRKIQPPARVLEPHAHAAEARVDDVLVVPAPWPFVHHEAEHHVDLLLAAP